MMDNPWLQTLQGFMCVCHYMRDSDNAREGIHIENKFGAVA